MADKRNPQKLIRLSQDRKFRRYCRDIPDCSQEGMDIRISRLLKEWEVFTRAIDEIARHIYLINTTSSSVIAPGFSYGGAWPIRSAAVLSDQEKRESCRGWKPADL